MGTMPNTFANVRKPYAFTNFAHSFQQLPGGVHLECAT